MTIRTKMILLPAIAIGGLLAIVAAMNFASERIQHDVVFPDIRELMLSAKSETLKDLVTTQAVALGDAMKDKETKDEKWAIAISTSDQITFFDDGSGYYFLYDLKGVRVNVPGKEGVDKTGKNCWDDKDAKDNYFIRDICAAGERGGDFVEYWFPKKGESEPSPKLSYIAPIPGTDLVIGAGVYMDSVDAQLAAVHDDMEEETAAYVWWIGAAIVTVIVVLAGVSFAFARSIIRPVRAAVEGVQRVSSGDLDVEMGEGSDEMGRMGASLNKMIDELRDRVRLAEEIARGNLNIDVQVISDHDRLGMAFAGMVDSLNQLLGQVESTAGGVSSGAAEMSSASQSLSQASTEQAASLEQISSSMQELSGQTTRNAENATQANQLSRQATDAASEGQSQMQEMVDSMSEITKNSDEVQKVIKVIDDIAFQTNLLALNAAVEAARAGQHGKGFAVVAEEVRNLAARSAKAARETAELIEGSSKRILEGAGIAEKTSVGLNQIADFIQKTTDILGEIAAASNEQAQGAAQINQGLGQLDQVTQRNTASAEETASASQDMAQQAGRLQKLIGGFRLKRSSSNAAEERVLRNATKLQKEVAKETHEDWGASIHDDSHARA